MDDAPVLDENGEVRKPSLAKLLNYGIDPNSLSFEETGSRRTLLCLAIDEAAKIDDMSKVDLLLMHKADPNLKSESGAFPLQLAVKHENVQLCRQLLKRKAEVNQHDVRQVTPLHLAVHQDLPRVVQILLLHKAHPNAADALGQTPIFFANSRTVASSLVDAGADMLHLNQKGQCALHLAAHNGASDAISYISEHDHMRNMIDLKDDRGRTPLHHAAAKGHQAVLSRLLDLGANPKSTTNNGQTALTLADAKDIDVAYYLYTRITGGNQSSWSEMAQNPIALTLAAVLGVAIFINRKLLWEFMWDLIGLYFS